MSNMPSGQFNAHLSDELVMRVGLPQRSGKLAFHAFNEGYAALVSANAFWNPRSQQFVVPEASDLYEVPCALDSAGFVAISQFQAKGKQPGIAGIYPWSLEAYVELAGLLPRDWWAQPDLCTESAGSQEEIDFRIDATATLLEATLRVVYAWQNELAKTCSIETVAQMLPPPVPVLQGRRPSDYLRSLDLLMQIWERWEPWLAPPKLIGIGSVCRRDLHDHDDGLYAILQSLDGALPAGSKCHLFGVKGAALGEVKKLAWVASTDSQAWDFSARQKALKGGHSNSYLHRTTEMTRWMSSALSRITPSVGSQMTLALHA